jgi:hypothetical protein
MAKLIKFGEHVPGNQVYSYTERRVKDFPLIGDPDAWILDVEDLECAAWCIKYSGWGLLSPETLQCPVISNSDDHNKPSDFLFKRISDIEIKLRVVAPEYPIRAKAIREAKEAGLNIGTTTFPDAVEALGISPVPMEKETTGADKKAPPAKKDEKPHGQDKAK